MNPITRCAATTKMSGRFVSLVENRTHVLFGSQMAGCAISEIALSKAVLPALKQGMLCLADRNFFGYEMWKMAQATGADLVSTRPLAWT